MILVCKKNFQYESRKYKKDNFYRVYTISNENDYFILTDDYDEDNIVKCACVPDEYCKQRIWFYDDLRVIADHNPFYIWNIFYSVIETRKIKLKKLNEI